MAVPNQLPRVQFQDFKDPVFQQHYWQLTDAVNTLLGHNGVIEVADHLSLGGNRIMNLGAPVAAADALSNAHAASLYAPAVLRPQFESASQNPLLSYRQLNNQTQREALSSFLNDLMSTPPTANNLFPTLTNSGGSVIVSLPPGLFYWADGKTTETIGRTDTFSVPAQYAITSIACAANTVVLSTGATGLVAGENVTISGVTPSSFNGTFMITSSSGGGTVLEYQLDLGTVSGTGGFAQVNGVYYYHLRKRSKIILPQGPFSSDSGLNRLQVSADGSQIVAVVTITNNGAQIALSGGGGSAITGSPTAGIFFAPMPDWI